MSKVDLDRFIDFMIEYKKETIKDYEKELDKFRPFTSAHEMKKEIKRLTVESTKWESKFYDEAKKNDKAIEELEIWQPKEKILQEEKEYLLDILKGVDKE